MKPFPPAERTFSSFGGIKKLNALKSRSIVSCNIGKAAGRPPPDQVPYLEIIGEINRPIGTVSVAKAYPIYGGLH